MGRQEWFTNHVMEWVRGIKELDSMAETLSGSV